MDVNTATLEELLSIEGVDEGMARDIILWRPFRSWDDLQHAMGLEPAMAENLLHAGVTVVPRDSSSWVTFSADLPRAK